MPDGQEAGFGIVSGINRALQTAYGLEQERQRREMEDENRNINLVSSLATVDPLGATRIWNERLSPKYGPIDFTGTRDEFNFFTRKEDGAVFSANKRTGKVDIAFEGIAPTPEPVAPFTLGPGETRYVPGPAGELQRIERPPKAERPEIAPAQALRRIADIETAVTKLQAGNVDPTTMLLIQSLSGKEKDETLSALRMADYRKAIEALRKEQKYLKQFAPPEDVLAPIFAPER